jgi:hypothetical protein
MKTTVLLWGFFLGFFIIFGGGMFLVALPWDWGQAGKAVGDCVLGVLLLYGAATMLLCRNTITLNDDGIRMYLRLKAPFIKAFVYERLYGWGDVIQLDYFWAGVTPYMIAVKRSKNAVGGIFLNWTCSDCKRGVIYIAQHIGKERLTNAAVNKLARWGVTLD